jgi:hypothetical protein
MEGCARKVSGISEDGKVEEERDNGRHNNDNNAITMNDDDTVLPLPLPLQSPLPSPLPLLNSQVLSDVITR